MNGSEQPATSPAAGSGGFEQQSRTGGNDPLRQLHGLVLATLVAVVLLAGALFLVLFRQVSMIRKELDFKNAAVHDFQTTKEPLITNFVAGLQGFARTHPDITPMLERYGIPVVPTAPSMTPLSPEGARK